jgi:hypothetical protein
MESVLPNESRNLATADEHDEAGVPRLSMGSPTVTCRALSFSYYAAPVGVAM